MSSNKTIDRTFDFYTPNIGQQGGKSVKNVLAKAVRQFYYMKH